MPEYVKVCPICKKEFKAARSDAIYCNVNCRNKAYRRSQQVEKKCKYCGKSYFRNVENKIKLFCSEDCKTKFKQDKNLKAVRKYEGTEKGQGNKVKTQRNRGIGTHQNITRPDITNTVEDWNKQIKEIQNLKKFIGLRPR